jgi:AP-3 complex subunit beta
VFDSFDGIHQKQTWSVIGQWSSKITDHVRADVVVSNAVLVLKSLVQSQAVSGDSSQSSLSIVSKLAQRVDEFHHPQAKACVIWLTGQYAEQVSGSAAPGTPAGIAPWAPDVLRQTTKTFGAEVSVVSPYIIC